MIVWKFLFAAVLFIICAIIGTIVPVTMYCLYGVIDPSSVFEKIATIGVFWFVGGGLSIASFVVALCLFFNGVKYLLDN